METKPHVLSEGPLCTAQSMNLISVLGRTRQEKPAVPSSSLISTFAFMCCQGGNQQSEYQVLILKSTKGKEAHNSFLLMIISKSPDILFAKTRILRGSMLAEVLISSPCWEASQITFHVSPSQDFCLLFSHFSILLSLRFYARALR